MDYYFAVVCYQKKKHSIVHQFNSPVEAHTKLIEYATDFFKSKDFDSSLVYVKTLKRVK